ncbi:MAG: hypothetical protein Fur0037_19270 [Planctomycetota bacterium]
MPETTDDLIQQAVEAFVDRRSVGESVDPEQFAGEWPEDLRACIADRCRRFLQFDAMLGAQKFELDVEKENGRAFGDYLILEELGRGGMGIVYLAVQRSLNRRVALKVMQSGLTLSKRHVERFRREAEAAARLRHPGIVAVHSFEEVGGTFAIAMDYVAGRNLGEVLDDLRLQCGNGPVDGSLGVAPGRGYAAECAALAAQIASALAAAHSQGIAHRDLKPRNLMLDENAQVRLLDFGLAKSVDADTLSVSGDLTGTIHYMSPEQTMGTNAEADVRTDIFSLGVILYELLTLTKPFGGRTMQEVVTEICFKDPVPIPKRNPRVPKDLVTICMKALEKAPQNRYRTAAEFEQDLQHFLRFEPIEAKPAGPLLRLAKWTRRHRTQTLTVSVAALAIGTFLGIGWIREIDARARADALMQSAEAAIGGGDYARAIAMATEALSLRPADAAIRAQVDLYQQKRITHETQEAADRAEASRLITRSSQEITRDRDVAVRLALEAVARRDSPEARSAVLRALGLGLRAVEYLPPTAGAAIADVLKASWSLDPGLVAVAHEDGIVRLWSLTGEFAGELLAFEKGVADIAFHPAPGARILAAAGDRMIRFFETAHRGLLTEIRAIGPIDRISFDAKGDRLLTVAFEDFHSGPWEVAVWDTSALTRGGKPTRLGCRTDHERWVQAAALSPDGETVASCGDNGYARVWRARDGEELARLPLAAGRVLDVAFSADSRLVAFAMDSGTAPVFSLPAGEAIATVRHAGPVNSIDFSPDSKALLTASGDWTSRLWSLDSDPRGRELLVFGGHGARVNRARFGSSGRYVATACGDGIARVFDAASGAEICRYEVGMPLNDASFDPADSSLLLWSRRSARRWDIRDRLGTVSIPHPSFVNAVAPAGPDRIATAGDDGTVRVFRARTGERVAQTKDLGSVVTSLAIDGAGERMAIGTWTGGLAIHSVWNCERLFELSGHESPVLSLEFSGGGGRLLSASRSGILVHNALDASTVFRIDGEFACAAIAPDASRVAWAEEGGKKVAIRAVAGDSLIRRIGPLAGAVVFLAFRPNGEELLTCEENGTARLWSPSGGRIAAIEAGIPISCAAFRPDGKQMLLCGGNALEQVAQLWDVEKRSLVLRFHGQRGQITSCAFSRDGAWAITGSRDRTACIWPTDPVSVARRLPLRLLTPEERTIFDLPPDTGQQAPR